MRSMIAVLVVAAASALAQDVAPSYSREGFDYFSAPVEPAKTRAVAHACEKQYGKHTEVEAKTEKTWRCSIPTASEPRLSTRLKDELLLLDEQPEPKRQRMTEALVDKYARLAQCPEGTQAYYDGSLYFCGRTYRAAELCPSGQPATLDTGKLGCVVSSCPAGTNDLSALTQAEHAGCFKCTKGTFDAKETQAFHGALKGMPAEFTEVFCKAKSAGKAAKTP